jgi:hypothetical protein
VFTCGEPLRLPAGSGPHDERSGLTLTIQALSPPVRTCGPALTVIFTARREVGVVCSPPTSFEVLYLQDGLIVGGGPMLTGPGLGLQAIDALAVSFTVTPDRPSSHRLGSRDRLCAGRAWSEVWSAPARYEIAVLAGPVLQRTDYVHLGVPGVGPPLLADRAPLPR